MKKSLTFILAGLLFNSAYSQVPAIKEKFIEVTGRSEKEVPPDNVEITITIRENENVKRENDLIEREKKIMDALKQLSIADADIAIDRITGSSGGYYAASNRYTIAKIYKVQIKDTRTVDNTIVKLFEAGANNVQISKLSNKNIEQFKLEAAIEAAQNARTRAEAIAKPLGVSVGTALEVRELSPVYREEVDNSDARFYSKSLYAEGAVHRGSNQEDQNVNMKKILLTYMVAVKFEIK
jgi:uncharacterized protein